MATVPLSGTNIRLLSGVPFSNDYKHTRWFDTITDQENYFLGKTVVHSIAQATFQRIEGKHFISVNNNIDDLWGTNYVMFQNASYNSKWFYAFVTKLEYKNQATTYVHFEIDVFQTWRFQWDFKPSYVLREHCPLWNADGTPVVNTQDEGLHYGANYEVQNVMNWKPYGDVFFMVIVCKSLMHQKVITDPVTNADKTLNPKDIYPNINATPQPLCYYIHPFKLDGSVPTCWDENSNEVIISKPIDVLRAMYEMDDAVNNVSSIYITDYLGFDFEVDASGTLRIPSTNFVEVDIMYQVSGSTTQNYLQTLFVNSMPSYIGKSAVFTNKYADYRTVKESKLLMYPYTVLTLDDMKGNRQTIKNEYIKDTDIHVTVHGSIGVSNKITYGIENYNIKDNLEPADWFLSSLENSLINSNPNDLPIVTDMLSAYLQGNRNSLENQKHSTIFNGILDSFTGLTNMTTGATSGALAGSELGPMGMVAGGIEGGLGGATQMVRGAGNMYLQLQGMQAKQKDINNTPPSLSKLGSNTYFDYGHNLSGLYLIKKQITPEYQKKLEDFFNVFGYKLNEIKVPNFHTRQYWNYIQTTGCMITGNFNHEDLQEIKNIFDGGITLWHTDDIGNYSLDNEVI